MRIRIFPYRFVEQVETIILILFYITAPHLRHRGMNLNLKENGPNHQKQQHNHLVDRH